MKRIFLTLAALCSMYCLTATEYLYIDNFEISRDKLGSSITVPVKAHFDYLVSGFQIDLTLPNGLTFTGASMGSDSYISYLDEAGISQTENAGISGNISMQRILGFSTFTTIGYWDPNGSGNYESYGTIKWEPGDYNEMCLITFDVAANFTGGEIIVKTTPACSSDARGNTCHPGQENYRYCQVTVEPAERDLTGNIIIGDLTESGLIAVRYDGPEQVELSVFVNGVQVPVIDGCVQLDYGDSEVIAMAHAEGYHDLCHVKVFSWYPQPTENPVISVYQHPTMPHQYVVQATGRGTVLLYVNDDEVSNPHVIERGDSDVTYYATATAQEPWHDISETVFCEFVVPRLISYDPDNYFTLPDMTAFHRDTIVIPVSMTNPTAITAFQTDIYLPNGFVALKDGYGDYMVDLSSRKSRDHVIMASDASDGAITVICYSTGLKTFKGNEGELFYITVKVPADASGDYPLLLKNSFMTTSEYEELDVRETSGTIHVLAFIAGDVNDSGTITVTDVVTVARYILDQHPTPFVVEAADINGDGIITVTDLVLIARMVMTAGYNAPLHSLPLTHDSLSAGSLSIEAGQTRTVSIELNNASRYTAMQLDLHLPGGLTASNFRLTGRAGKHQLDASILDDGTTTRVLCYSPALAAIDGTEGVLLTFDVTATAPVEDNIVVDGIEMVTTGYQTARLEPLAIGVNATTSTIETAVARGISRIDYYNVAGQHLSQPCQGVNIVVTTYSDGSRSTVKVNQ